MNPLPTRDARAGLRHVYTRYRSSPIARFGFGTVLPAAATIIGTPALARALGASDYGTLAICTTAATIGAALSLGWLEILAVRQLVGQGQSLERFISGISLPLVISVLVPLVGAAIAGAVLDSTVLILLS